MVKDVLISLITNPGLFEDYMQSLVQTLNATITTYEQLGAIADIIFEQVIHNGENCAQQILIFAKLHKTDYQPE